MAKNVRNAREKRSTPSGTGKIILSIIFGLVLGAILAFGVAWYLTRNNPFDQKNPAVDPSLGQQVQPQYALPGKPGGKPIKSEDYDFYNMLPKAQNATAPTQNATEANPVTTSPDKPSIQQTLYLQIAAFRDGKQADNMKAELSLNGIEPIIQHSILSDHSVIYRVRVGPFADTQSMEGVRSHLSSLGLSATVIRGEGR